MVRWLLDKGVQIVSLFSPLNMSVEKLKGSDEEEKLSAFYA